MSEINNKALNWEGGELIFTYLLERHFDSTGNEENFKFIELIGKWKPPGLPLLSSIKKEEGK